MSFNAGGDLIKRSDLRIFWTWMWFLDSWSTIVFNGTHLLVLNFLFKQQCEHWAQSAQRAAHVVFLLKHKSKKQWLYLYCTRINHHVHLFMVHFSLYCSSVAAHSIFLYEQYTSMSGWKAFVDWGDNRKQKRMRNYIMLLFRPHVQPRVYTT